MVNYHQLHNEFFIANMQKKAVAQSFMEGHLPKAIKAMINLATIQVQDGAYVDEDLKNAHTDILYKVQYQDQSKSLYLYVLVEHQSTADAMMPLRLLHDQCRILKKHISQVKGKLPVIYPLVFYHGRVVPYPYTCNFFDLFADKTLATTLFNHPFHLVDVTQIPDAQLRKHKWASLMQLLQKHIRQRDLIKRLPLILEHIMETTEDCGDVMKMVLKYLVRAGNIDNNNEFVRIMGSCLDDAEGDDIIRAIQARAVSERFNTR